MTWGEHEHADDEAWAAMAWAGSDLRWHQAVCASLDPSAQEIAAACGPEYAMLLAWIANG